MVAKDPGRLSPESMGFLKSVKSSSLGQYIEAANKHRLPSLRSCKPHPPEDNHQPPNTNYQPPTATPTTPTATCSCESPSQASRTIRCVAK